MDNMNFRDFCEQVQENIGEYLPTGYEGAQIKLQKVTKNNDTNLVGLLITKADSNVTPNIYLETFYENYQKGDTLEEVMQEIARVRVKHEPDRNTFSIDVTALSDLEVARDNIRCKLINKAANEEYLVDKPYKEIVDLAIVYLVNCGNNRDGQANVVVTYNLLKSWGISEDELHEIAMKNLEKNGFEFRTMREVLMEFIGMEDIPEEEMPQMYVLSNSAKINGAVAILDEKLLQDISEKVGGDYIIIPSSIHEVLVVPNNGKMESEEIRAMICDVNSTQVAPDEVLSDHPYIYSNGKLTSWTADEIAA